MKKYIAILLIAGVIVSGIIYYIQKEKTPEYLKEQQNIDIADKEKRDEYLKEFESKPVTNPGNNVNQWEGGFKGIDIEGLNVLMENNLVENIDKYIEIEEKLNAGLEILDVINNDIKRKSNELEDYYILNKKTLSNIYGHTEYKDFIEFTKTLEFMKENEEIKKITIQKAERIGNILELHINIETKESTSGEIKILGIYSEKQKNYLLVWK